MSERNRKYSEVYKHTEFLFNPVRSHGIYSLRLSKLNSLKWSLTTGRVSTF